MLFCWLDGHKMVTGLLKIAGGNPGEVLGMGLSQRIRIVGLVNLLTCSKLALLKPMKQIHKNYPSKWVTHMEMAGTATFLVWDKTTK